MTRLGAALLAVVAFAAALPTEPSRALLATALLGLLLAAAGIVMLWRWPLTAAAGVCLVDYAAGLWLFAPAPSLVRPVVLGVCLLLMLAAVELARATRRAAVDPAVVRSQAAGWAGFGLGTAAAAMLVMAAADRLVTTIAADLAPFLAAAGALGALLTLAATIRGGWRSPGRSHEAE